MQQKDKKIILKTIAQANKALNNQDQQEALFNFQKVCNIETDDLELLIPLSVLANKLNEYVHAIIHLKKAIELQPDNAVLHDCIAFALIESGHTSSAVSHLKKALEINPNLTEALTRLGVYEKDFGEPIQAQEYLERSIELKPSYPVTYYHLITVLTSLGDYERAIHYSKKLNKLVKDPVALTIHARLLNDTGDTEQAEIYLKRANRADAGYGLAYHDMAQLKKFQESDRGFIDDCHKALKKDMSTSSRSLINFALGKVHNDLKEWDTAFEYYRQGNILAKPAIDNSSFKKELKRLKEITFSRLLSDPALKRNQSEVPVFIVCMPRSGSTLIEQIIASHPQAGGAGELEDIWRLAYKLIWSGQTAKQALDNIREEIDENYLIDISEKYLKTLRHNRQDCKRIVDKLPDNFKFLHFIHLLFPKAHIINLTRNPIDTALSCFFQSFQKVDWSFDIEEICKRYNYYADTMKYWKKHLPEQKVLDVRYEDLIEDTETQTRRIIEFLGLPWDDRCLDFHRKKRTISTASVWQARQPIYKTSSSRWVNYAKHIEPFARGLKNHLDDEQIALLKQHGINIQRGWLSKLLP